MVLIVLLLAWSTRLTQITLFEKIKQISPLFTEQIERLNYPSEAQQQPALHPVEIVKNLIDMLLAAISSPVYADLFVVCLHVNVP